MSQNPQTPWDTIETGGGVLGLYPLHCCPYFFPVYYEHLGLCIRDRRWPSDRQRQMPGLQREKSTYDAVDQLGSETLGQRGLPGPKLIADPKIWPPPRIPVCP